ncbi:MAG: type I pullulanase [Bacilli bacterium]|nr:type I pullulanase [Bacilli bacterium]MCH4210317.1 type I pullulanase [Bacilli bacterium]MCH4228962.1 type I pullulanase [Bacilli bacterium]MCH4278409.1 type I pullulanase [Bacilli bacterium]MCI2054807.1 type I pullulanase [Bacilli bacterium]
MKDTFLSARLVNEDLIRLVIFSSVPYEKFDAFLIKDRTSESKLSLLKMSSMASVLIADYHLSSPLELGHSYMVAIRDFGRIALDVNEATSFPDFDSKYAYDGDDLGANCTKTRTSFALWAPLASAVLLKFKLPNEGRWHLRNLERTEKGVWRLSLNGDFDGMLYTYLVTNSEITVSTTDPYAKASTPNSKESVVIDFSKLKKRFHKEALPVLSSYSDAIIYEANVRDLSIDKHTDILKKGTYAGLIEPNRKTNDGNPAGFDYVCSLGITHLQLQPIYDFKTVDELNPFSSYNWGYDPVQYFCPEGSFSSDVADPKNRLIEVQEMVDAFNKAGIRIIQDVVYNHVYEYLFSPFEKVVPNYYFRHKANGRMADTSYCGDDVASERKMVHKLIVDACKWWIDFYGIDGFRFDLMGIIDVETLKEIEDYGKKKDPSFMVYGEGWNMGSECHIPLGNMSNYKLLPGYAFFNDKFRENAKRYLSGDLSVSDGLRFAFLGSSMEYAGNHPLFLNTNQSINYVECHDNATFYDYLSSIRGDLDEKERLALSKVALALCLFSFGVPFVHMGQEIAQSKWGKDNTYNLPDVYNRFSYRLLDERKEMYDYFRSLVSFRKKHRFLHLYDPRAIAPMVDLNEIEGAFHVHFSDHNETAPYKEVDFYFNVTDEELTINFPSPRAVVIDTSGALEKPSEPKNELVVPKHSFFGVASF